MTDENMADDMAEIIEEFLVESHESLDRLDNDFLALEEHPDDVETLSRVFRAIHTIKGTASFLDFGQLEAVSHVGEDLLSRLRDGALKLDRPRTDALLAMVDAIRASLDAIEERGGDSQVDHSELVLRLRELTADSGGSPSPAPAGQGEAGTSEGDEDPTSTQPDQASPEPAGGETTPIDPTSTQPDGDSPMPAGGETTPIDPTSTEPSIGGEAQSPVPAPARGGSESSIRVDVALLDRVMALVGELVLARNQVLEHAKEGPGPALLATTQRLNLITSELQEQVMKTRMQQIRHVWSRFPRVVRDLALSCGKEVALEMIGAETELDKTLLEAIRDPLTHIVRNSVDHGIEDPDTRRAAGKPSTGHIRLTARHEGGQVLIEICDDGKGLDLQRVREKAIQNAGLDPDRVMAMSDREAAALVFLPGLSTAEKVTNVSGRGVGMDVVKQGIEAIGGTVEISTELGAGTSLTLRVPLTLAIIPALNVMCSGQQYLIPQVSLVELLRVDQGSTSHRVETAGTSRVFRLRGELLPIVYLSEVLGLGNQALDDRRLHVHNIAVLRAEGSVFGLAVDSVLSTEEIVVKPLSSALRHLDFYSGTTILGDGRVALILDAAGLARYSGVAGDETSDQMNSDLEDGPAVGSAVLVCAVGDRRVGISLAQITRLERFPAETLEFAAGREVVQYRGDLLEITRLADLLGVGTRSTEPETLTLLIREDSSGFRGLAVDRILDLTSAGNLPPLPSDENERGDLVSGSISIDGQVTDILDLGQLTDRGRELAGRG